MSRIIDPAAVLELDDKALMTLFSQIEADITELTAGVTEIRRIFQERLQEKDLKSTIINNRPIVRFPQVAFTKTTIEQAEDLGAVDMVKKKNTKKLRILHDEGVEVPGVSVVERVRIGPEQS